MKYTHCLIAAAILAASPAGATTFTYTGAGGPIPDNGTNSTAITVADSFTVVDVNVFVDGLYHFYPRDVQMFLERGDQSVRLINNDGPNSSGSFAPTLGFDDEADAPISAYQSGTSGPYRPTDPLSTFDGEGAAGGWTLRVADVSGGGSGVYTGWRLVLDDGQVSPPPAGVPEPATWGLMLLGFGAVGAATRRRRTAVTFAA